MTTALGIETTLEAPDGSPLEIAVRVDDVNGVTWKFRLNAPGGRANSNTKYPWEFIGGNDAVAYDAGIYTPGGTGWLFPGATVTVPLDGQYEYEVAATVSSMTTGGTFCSIGTSVDGLSTPADIYTTLPVSSSDVRRLEGHAGPAIEIAAGHTLAVGMQVSQLTASFNERSIRVKPRRVRLY